MFRIARLEKRRDSGESLVSFIFIMPLFFALLMTMIDTSVYFANRSMVQQVARDGARTVAILGGAGNETQATPLEEAYGTTLSEACSGDALIVVGTGTTTPVNCGVAQRLIDSKGFINVAVNYVSCGPDVAPTVGSSTYCEVGWNYGGIPGSGLSFIKKRDGDSRVSVFDANITRVSSSSEVGLDGLVPRSS